jgi:hypothetical protein
MADESGAVEGVAGADVPGDDVQGELPFVAPVLDKYTDMQELLLLDPIHEVDASGWPKLPDDDRDSGR